MSYSFAKGTVDHSHSTFPQWSRLLTTAQNATVELEVLHENLLGQEIGAAVNHLPSKEGFHVLEWLIIEHFSCLLQVTYLTYRQAVWSNVQSCEIYVPIHFRNQFLQFFDGHLVVVGYRIAQLYIAQCSIRQTSLQTQYCLCFLCGIGDTKKCEHLLDMLQIFGTNVLGMFVLVDVIIFLAEGESGLVFVEDIHARIHSVSIHIHGPKSEVHGLAQYL